MTELIQLPDDPNTDPQFAYYYGWGEVTLPANCFMVHVCPVSERSYLGQIASPQLNFNQDGLPAMGNQTANLLQALAGERIVRDVGIKEVFWYRIKLLREVTTGHPASVRRRPQIGARARQATEAEVVQFLNLRPALEACQLGSLVDADVAVCLDEWLLKHHILVAGTTGSGKSNTVANIIHAAQTLGMHAIIYDHKPDYQHLHLPNNEDLSFDYYTRGLKDVSYWHLGGTARNSHEQNITVPAYLLDPEVLAATICYQHGETNMAETLEMLLQRYRDDQAEAKKLWTLKEFYRWLPPNAKACGEILDVEVHANTYAGMRARLQRPARIPSWIDGTLTPAARTGLNIGHFALEKEVGPGNITVIRIDNSVNSGRSYGLFLSYILNMAWNLRAGRRVKCPILHVIDEAQDIFDAGSTFKNAVGNMFDAQIRRGRSKGVGFVIAAQSAGAVPEEIRNLTNSRFIHRHKNSQQAREALEQASAAQLAMIDTFAAGECLAEINGAHGLVHVQMRPSPFQLTKDED